MKAFLVITLMNTFIVFLYALALILHALKQIHSRIKGRFSPKIF
jgi:hypothetical protein